MFRKVFVVYPRGMQTGGPEALHQLVDVLRRSGQDAVLVPRPGTEDRDRVPAYRVYDAPEAARVEDRSDCAVVSPEDVPAILAPYRRAAPFCWWLSVDNAAPFRDRQALNHRWANRPVGLREALKMRARVPYHDLQRKFAREDVLLRRISHLAQSSYAARYIREHLHLDSRLLSDHTPLAEFDARRFPPPSERDEVVAYNPVKSGHLVDQLRSLIPRVEFRALEGMTRAGVIDALGSSSIYLDLGNHPGKDRLPREAALANAVVLVGRRGSAEVREDVPLEDDFKIDVGPGLLRSARDSIEEVLAEPDAAWRRQDGYRESIRGERDRFAAEASAAFGTGATASEASSPRSNEVDVPAAR